MNSAYENLLTRRSIRKYTAEPVSEELLDKILEAGLYAPTGMNRQDVILLSVRDRALRDRLSALNAAVMNGSGDPFYGAPDVVIVLADKNNGCWLKDGSLAMGNLMNAAHALGIASCWIDRATEMFETEEGRSILNSLGIPDNFAGVGNCILGYADCDLPAPSPRKEGRIYRA